jgi:hypothetical protein
MSDDKDKPEDQPSAPETHTPSTGARLFGELLEWAVTSIARAGAKALESIADDTRKAVEGHASKAAEIRDSVAGWRAEKLGDEDGDDLPGSLRSHGRSNGSATGSSAP